MQKQVLAPTIHDINELKYWIKKIKLNLNEAEELFIKNFNKILSRSEDEATKKSVNIILGFQ